MMGLIDDVLPKVIENRKTLTLKGMISRAFKPGAMAKVLPPWVAS